MYISLKKKRKKGDTGNYFVLPKLLPNSYIYLTAVT